MNTDHSVIIDLPQLSISFESNEDKADEKKLTTLPPEVITHIFSFLELRDISKVSRACKMFQRLTSEGIVWKSLYFKVSAKQVHEVVPKLFDECRILDKSERKFFSERNDPTPADPVQSEKLRKAVTLLLDTTPDIEKGDEEKWKNKIVERLELEHSASTQIKSAKRWDICCKVSKFACYTYAVGVCIAFYGGGFGYFAYKIYTSNTS